MRIVIIVEGKTEKAFKPILHDFLKTRLEGKMPKLIFRTENGSLPTGDKLRLQVERYLSGKEAADHVIWLTDVFPGNGKWSTGEEAKQKAREWTNNNSTFHPHVAQYDFEAWLIPYWHKIQKLAKANKVSPGSNPELINNTKPPAYHLKQVFELSANSYIKSIHAKKILEGQDLMIAINACPELKAFVNTILRLSEAEEIH